MYCHVHQKTRNEAQNHKSNNNTKTKTKNKTHEKQTNTNHQAVTWQLPVYGWKRSNEARGDSKVSSRRMQMTTCVPYWRRLIKINNNKTNHKITMGHLGGCRKQQSSMRKPGIPPARIPEITKSSLHGMTFTLTLWSKHRQSRVATKVVRKTTAVKQESETWSKVKMTGRLRHSGHTQSPLSSAFPIIILARVIYVHCHECWKA